MSDQLQQPPQLPWTQQRFGCGVSTIWFNVGISTGCQSECEPLLLLLRASHQHKISTDGNFLGRPADGLKQRLRFSGFKSVGSPREPWFIWCWGRGSIPGQHESYTRFVARCCRFEPGMEGCALGFNHTHWWVTALFLSLFATTMRLCAPLREQTGFSSLHTCKPQHPGSMGFPLLSG